MADSSNNLTRSGHRYFSRRLSYETHSGETRIIDERELASLSGPKVVLGEPGMGKTELLAELGRQLGTTPIGANRFSHSKDAAGFVTAGKPLIIDALDEAMARRDGDAVDAVLAQLEVAGRPDFILSCRSREWQSRAVTNLADIYGQEPILCTILPLARDEAARFLEELLGRSDVEWVLDQLDRHRLESLYQNPLTLRLIARVAETDTTLPPTRAGLFERVCSLIWPEHDEDRQDSGLAQLTEAEALGAAGAACAALLFAGAENICELGTAQLRRDDIRLADIEQLPGAARIRAVYGSKLFQSNGTGRARPIHRVVAEYLASRWLGGVATSPRMQRRLLTQLQGGGAVPASLRGLHSWLSVHSPGMAAQVIAADPYGVLRSGDPATLSAAQADCLFDALRALADDDPYFRASDWDSDTAASLMIPPLRDKIRAVISDPAANGHLSSLLIEGLVGTSLAGDLSEELAEIMISRDYFFRQRNAAGEALRPHRDTASWVEAVERLRALGDEDSTRLAKDLLVEVGLDQFPNALVVAVIFAELGLTVQPYPQTGSYDGHMVRTHHGLAQGLSGARIPAILDLLADFSAALISPNDWQSENDIAQIVAQLTLRAIDEGIVGEADAAQIWRWLGVIEDAHRFHRDAKEDLLARLERDHELRRAIQRHVLEHERGAETIWMIEIHMNYRGVGLSNRPADVTSLLAQVAATDNQVEANRQDWRDLVRLATGAEGLASELAEIAEPFVRGDRELRNYLRGHVTLGEPAWQRQERQRQARRAQKEAQERAEQRADYGRNVEAMRLGDFRYIHQPARAYLGQYSDLDRSVPPFERVAIWLGEPLRDAAFAGFEAVLHRNDRPTAKMIAAGAVEGRTYKLGYAIVAAMFERHRAGRGVDDLPDDVCIAALLLVESDCCMEDTEKSQDAVRAMLERRLFSGTAQRIAFARLWIEPYLEARSHYVPGLYKLKTETEWHEAGRQLSAEWLERFDRLPEHIEVELVDCLTACGGLAQLKVVAEKRSRGVFRDFEHLLIWLAIDVLVRFEEVEQNLGTIAADHPRIIWFLRNRLRLERSRTFLPLDVAQRAWIVSQFRGLWPYATLRGSGSGDHNPYDATNFLRTLISQLADDTGDEAAVALRAIADAPDDSYSDLARHMAVEQRQKRAEERFEALPVPALASLVTDRAPTNIDDLRSVVVEELRTVQAKLIGEDIDELRDFWNDAGIPRDENRCRDRLAAMIGPELARYGIQRITEADMPVTKRADLAYAIGQLQLPMEIKGQWHSDVWDAASGQLDVQYLSDWRSEQRGIYCVLWFSEQPAPTRRRLKPPPDGLARPETADDMRVMLVERIPVSRRPTIDVIVLDLATGYSAKWKPKR